MSEKASVTALTVSGLSCASDRLVLAILALHADATGDGVITWAELTKKSQISRSSIGNSLRRLEEESFITRQRFRVAGRSGPMRYKLDEKLLVTPTFPATHVGSDSDLEASSAPVNPRVPLRDSGIGTVKRTGDVAHNVGEGVDGLSHEGLKHLLGKCVDSGWKGPASEALGAAVIAEVEARLGWIARRRVGMSFAEAQTDLVSRVWEVLREDPEKFLASARPWGLATRIVQSQIAREDKDVFSELAVDTFRDDEAPIGDHDRGVGALTLEDLLDGPFSSSHQRLVHRLIEAGVPGGVAFMGTLRMLELATAAPSSAIARARCDDVLIQLGISERAIGPWMGLIVGTRRGGQESSFLLRISRGGEGVTDDEKRRFYLVADEFRKPTIQRPWS